MPLNVLLAGGADSTMRQAFAQAAQDVAAGGDVLVTPGPFRRAHEIDEVRAMAHKHGIGLIVPTIDDDLPLWAALAGGFAAAGIHVAVSSASTVAMCHDRHLTCRSLNLMGIPAAATWLPAQVTTDLPFPLMVVSRNPRTGVLPVRVSSARELDFCLSHRPDAIVQVALDGPEFEVDICCDLTGHLISVTPTEWAELAVCVASAVQLVGPATIYGTLAGDRPVVRTISPRLSTTMDLTQGAAARVPSALVEMALVRRTQLGMYGGLAAVMGAVA